MSESSKSAKPVRSTSVLLRFVCFIAVICVGISLLLSKVGLSGQISNALSIIAQVLSYIVLIVISSFYVVRKKNVWLWVVWAIAVILIIVGVIL